MKADAFKTAVEAVSIWLSIAIGTWISSAFAWSLGWISTPPLSLSNVLCSGLVALAITIPLMDLDDWRHRRQVGKWWAPAHQATFHLYNDIHAVLTSDAVTFIESDGAECTWPASTAQEKLGWICRLLDEAAPRLHLTLSESLESEAWTLHEGAGAVPAERLP